MRGRYTRSMRTKALRNTAAAALAVLTLLPLVATVCALRCAPAGRASAAAPQPAGAPACHEAPARTGLRIGAAVEDCAPHEAAFLEVAIATSQRTTEILWASLTSPSIRAFLPLPAGSPLVCVAKSPPDRLLRHFPPILRI